MTQDRESSFIPVKRGTAAWEVRFVNKVLAIRGESVGTHVTARKAESILTERALKLQNRGD